MNPENYLSDEDYYEALEEREKRQAEKEEAKEVEADEAYENYLLSRDEE